MTLYLVEGSTDLEISAGHFVEQSWIYGVFSSKERADEIANNLKNNISKHNEQEKIMVTDIKIDEPTLMYKFMMRH